MAKSLAKELAERIIAAKSFEMASYEYNLARDADRKMNGDHEKYNGGVGDYMDVDEGVKMEYETNKFRMLPEPAILYKTFTSPEIGTKIPILESAVLKETKEVYTPFLAVNETVEMCYYDTPAWIEIRPKFGPSKKNPPRAKSMTDAELLMMVKSAKEVDQIHLSLLTDPLPLSLSQSRAKRLGVRKERRAIKTLIRCRTTIRKPQRLHIKHGFGPADGKVKIPAKERDESIAVLRASLHELAEEMQEKMKLGNVLERDLDEGVLLERVGLEEEEG